MMECSYLEEGTIINDVRNLFTLEKEIVDAAMTDIMNLFRFKKKQKKTKKLDIRILRDIRNLFEHKKNYYKPVSVGNFWSNNQIDYESKGGRNKTLLVKEYLNKIRLYLKDIINNLKKYDTWEIQLTIAINFISSKDNGKELVVHLKSDNIEIMINDGADKVIKELFKSLKNRYQNNLESMKGSKFIFYYVRLLYYKLHKVKANRA